MTLHKDLDSRVQIVSSSTSETIALGYTNYIRQTTSGITTSFSGAVSGMKIYVKNDSDGTNNINVTIEGNANPEIYSGEGFAMVYNGADWELV